LYGVCEAVSGLFVKRSAERFLERSGRGTAGRSLVLVV